jgi:hypothetical protein
MQQPSKVPHRHNDDDDSTATAMLTDTTNSTHHGFSLLTKICQNLLNGDDSPTTRVCWNLLSSETQSYISHHFLCHIDSSSRSSINRFVKLHSSPQPLIPLPSDRNTSLRRSDSLRQNTRLEYFELSQDSDIRK